MSPFRVDCPDCGSAATVVGPIPATDVFAGRKLSSPLSGGNLYRCPTCLLGFRWPRLAKAELDQLYHLNAGTVWKDQDNRRNDWPMAYELLGHHLDEGASILDVGCFDGSFLAPLNGHHHCFGIEINQEAAQQARASGVTIVGGDFEDIRGEFDCITAFDVIEHVESPHRFIQDCVNAVRRGGIILISTGNLDASTFQLAKGRYWYSAIAEHISFVSPAWFVNWQSQCGYEVISLGRFSHAPSGIGRRLVNLMSNGLYLFLPVIFRALRRHGFGQKNALDYPVLLDHPPMWETAQDHLIALLRKP